MRHRVGSMFQRCDLSFIRKYALIRLKYPQHCFLVVGVCAERKMFTRENVSGVFGSICNSFFKAEYIILVSICSISISPRSSSRYCSIIVNGMGAYIYLTPLIFAQTYIYCYFLLCYFQKCSNVP